MCGLVSNSGHIQATKIACSTSSDWWQRQSREILLKFLFRQNTVSVLGTRVGGSGVKAHYHDLVYLLRSSITSNMADAVVSPTLERSCETPLSWSTPSRERRTGTRLASLLRERTRDSFPSQWTTKRTAGRNCSFRSSTIFFRYFILCRRREKQLKFRLATSWSKLLAAVRCAVTLTLALCGTEAKLENVHPGSLGCWNRGRYASNGSVFLFIRSITSTIFWVPSRENDARITSSFTARIAFASSLRRL